MYGLRTLILAVPSWHSLHFNGPAPNLKCMARPSVRKLFRERIEKLMGEDRTFVPRAGELKALCERERQAVIAAHPFSACQQCCGGWRDVKVNGASFAERCSCWSAHWARLEGLGVTAKPLALPSASDEGAA